MRSSRLLRICCCLALGFALFGAISVVSAQDATEEAMSDPMMSEMMAMEGACPEGWAATRLDELGMEMGASGTDMTMTDEPMAEATHDMSGMEMTDEPMDMATMEPGMETTDEMGTMGVTCLYAELAGENEVPGPGDEDGYGVAFVSIDPASDTVCYEVAVANITLPAAAQHIHVNAAGLSGDVVIPFPTAPDAEGMASGCTTADVEGLLEAIVTTPEGYYVNVHTSDFPAGAVRGQLMNWEDHEMGMGDTDMNGDMDSSMEMTDEASSDSGDMMEATAEATASS